MQEVYSYFENEEGEQAIFTYDCATKKGNVVLGDAGWENIYLVDDGYAVGLVLGPSEKVWLVASWSAATRQHIMEVFEKSMAKEAEYIREIRRKIDGV